jgi:hypothetical protein
LHPSILIGAGDHNHWGYRRRIHGTDGVFDKLNRRTRQDQIIPLRTSFHTYFQH